MKPQVIFIAVALLLLCPKVDAQSVELTDIRKKEFRGVFPITNKLNNEVKGYYSFYINEKEAKGMRNFVIAIFDENVDLVKQTDITITKGSEVDGAEFDGENFLFIFNDISKRQRTMVSCDVGGNIIKEVHLEEEKGNNYNAEVFAASTGGFYVVMPIREKRVGFSVAKYDRELNVQWENRFLPESGFLSVEDIQSGNGRIVIIQKHQLKLMSKKVTASLLALDDANGGEIFSYSLFDGTYTRQPSAFVIDENQDITTAGMYFEGEKWDAVNSDGIFFFKISKDGEEIISTTEDWENGIQRVIKEGSKKTFTISSKPKVLFHNIIVDVNGNYQVIGETFKKSVQAVSIRPKDAISGRYIGDINADAKPMTFEVMDFIVFNFTSEGNMDNINMIEKEHTKISCYAPYHAYGGLSLALKVRQFGWFNYGFMQGQSGTDDQKMISKMFEKDPYIGVWNFEDGQLADMTRIPIDKKTISGGSIGVMPGKPGNIGVFIYSKKDKTLLIYLQEFDL